MLRHSAAPLPEQILYDIIIPPIGAAFWWLMSSGLAGMVQGGTVNEKTKQRQKVEFKVLLVAAYVLMFAITILGYLTRK